jgi:uncharacterized protein YjdB
LYINGAGIANAKIYINFPVTMELVEALEETNTKNTENAVGALTISYLSSNEKVAVIDKDGNITAVGEGKTLITAKITLYSGKTKVVKKYITVKTNK